MARHFSWVFVIALLFAASSSAASLCDQQRGGHDPKKSEAAPSQDPARLKWWLDLQSRKEIGVTDQQSKQIDQIFESTMPKQRERWRELEKLRDALSQTIKANTADVATVALQVERVENVNAEFRKIRTMMIYRMNAVLSPDQRAKLEKFEEARRARHDELKKKQPERNRLD